MRLRSMAGISPLAIVRNTMVWWIPRLKARSATTMFSTCRDPVRCSCHNIAEGHLTSHTTHLRGDFQACVGAGVGVVTGGVVVVAVTVFVVVCNLACFFPWTCRFHADSDVTVTLQQGCGKLITPDVVLVETAN